MQGIVTVSKESWADFKTEVTDRAMCPQWYEDRGYYNIFALDGFFMFTIQLDVSDTGAGTDTTDFNDNYKSSWNLRLDYRDSTGLLRLHASPRPENYTTYFTGVGDDTSDASEANWTIGDGNEAYLSLTASDDTKEVKMTFTEDVYIKDGIMFFDSAPAGAKIDVYINYPGVGAVAYFIRGLRIKGDCPMGVYLNSEDGGKMAKGLELVIKVHNGDTNAAFDVWASIEMYRINTV